MRRPRRALSQINVVPYIDVMLVLLVIFMVAAPMMQPSVVNLPQIDHADKTISTPPLRLTIQEDNQYVLHHAGQETTYRDKQRLVQYVTQLLAQHTQQSVVIAADKSIRYEKVMEIMSALKQANVARVGLLVQSN